MDSNEIGISSLWWCKRLPTPVERPKRPEPPRGANPRRKGYQLAHASCVMAGDGRSATSIAGTRHICYANGVKARAPMPDQASEKWNSFTHSRIKARTCWNCGVREVGNSNLQPAHPDHLAKVLNLSGEYQIYFFLRFGYQMFFHL